ncbi:MAG TPA: metal-dependent hydrolase [Nitrospirae bacterium]|nr:metal-dependent hydrolase [Nitrospirota bacterium]
MLVSVIASRAAGGRKPVRKHFEQYYYLSLIGVLSHVFLDLFTPYGVGVLAPIDYRYYSFASVYYLDPVIALVLFTGFMVSRRKRKYAKKALIAALVICLVYLGGRTAARQAAFSFARGKLDNFIVKSISPMPLSLWQWWYVARLADGSKRTGVLDLLAGNSYEAASYPPDARSPLAAVARRTELARGFLHLFPDAHVVASKDDVGRTVVTFRALSYSFQNESKFTVMVYLNSSGKVVGRKAVF